jgi:hypothetical protein
VLNLATALALLVFVLAVHAGTADAATPSLAFSPATQTVGVGASGNVDVTVANVTNLGGYHLAVAFNAGVVHVTSMTDSGFLGTGSNIIVCNPAVIDNTAGTATLDCATVSPLGPPGPGVSAGAPTALAHVAFTAVGAGVSTLSLSGSTLEDPVATPIAASLTSGSVTVTGATLTPIAKVGGIAELPDGAMLPPASAQHGGAPWWPAGLVAVAAVAAIAALAARRARRR